MANFANINSKNKVMSVIAIADRDCGGGKFPESEPIGQKFINEVLNIPGKWLQTSYNGSFRCRYAGMDGYYNEERDSYIPRKPFESWILNNETLDWESPIPYPDDENEYYWDETIKNWKEVKVSKEIVEE